MGMLDIIWLLATVSSLTANVTHHYFMIWPANSIIPCNWRIRIYCNESSVISILNIMVVNTTCDENKCVCPTGLNDSINIASEARSIPEYIKYQCHNKTSCDNGLPHPGISQNRQMTNVTIQYKCTDITGTDTTKDTSTSNMTTGTTVCVSSLSATHANGSLSEDPGTEIQPSSWNVVSTVVPTVLIFVAITLVMLAIIVRRKQRKTHAGDKTALRSGDNVDLSQDGASAEANRSSNVSGVRLSTMADDNIEYNTINLITFKMIEDPTYSHVSSVISNPRYNKTIVSPLIDSDYASCADIDETMVVDDTYSHITNITNTSYEVNSKQVFTTHACRSDYDDIELAKCDGIHVDESTSDENTFSHIGMDSLKKMSLVDVDLFGGDYSHIGHVARVSEAECSTNNQAEVSEARSSKSNLAEKCENKLVSSNNSENNKCNDLQDSKERKCENINSYTLSEGDVEDAALYQLKEFDDSSESDHFYHILEKKQ